MQRVGVIASLRNNGVRFWTVSSFRAHVWLIFTLGNEISSFEFFADYNKFDLKYARENDEVGRGRTAG